jgi:hypothetical protein
MIENFVDDFRHALRGLGRDPVLALTAAATLAICVGANTAVFSIVNTILLRPLPYPGAERLFWISAVAGKRRQDLVTGPEYYVTRKQQRIFEDIGAYTTTTANWTGLDKPEQLDVGVVTPSFFRVFATAPLLGRYRARRGRSEPASRDCSKLRLLEKSLGRGSACDRQEHSA